MRMFEAAIVMRQTRRGWVLCPLGLDWGWTGVGLGVDWVGLGLDWTSESVTPRRAATTSTRPHLPLHPLHPPNAQYNS